MSLWILSIVICAVGLLGNFLVIAFVVYCGQLRKSTSNWYIFHMAIADTLFLLSIPFTVSQYLNDVWIYATGFCPILLTQLYLNLYASVLFLSVLSFDRYITVCQPFSKIKKILQDRKVSNLIAAVLWIVSLCCCIPVILYSGVQPITQECTMTFPPDETLDPMDNDEGNYDLGSGDYDNSTYYNTYTTSADAELHGNNFYPDCTYEHYPSGYQRLIVFNFAVMYALPVFIMIPCYGLLVWRISAGGPVSTTRQVRSRGRKSASTKRATIMCAALVSCFVILCLPFQIFHLGKLFGWHVEMLRCNNMREMFNNMIYLNSALNPYLYTFLCSSFRRRLKSWFYSFRNGNAQFRRSLQSNGSQLSTTRTARFRRKSSTANVSTKSKESSAPSSGHDMEMKNLKPAP